MPTRPRDPFAELISPRQLVLDRLADTAHIPPARLSADTRAAPLPFDIFDNGEQLVVIVDLTGADPGSVDVETQPRYLAVSATFSPAVEPPPLTYSYQAACCGTVSRQVELPAVVAPESAQARLENGRLHVTVQKAQAQSVRVPGAGE